MRREHSGLLSLEVETVMNGGVQEENGNWVNHFTRQSTETNVVTRLC